jgi:hypothetical protein
MTMILKVVAVLTLVDLMDSLIVMAWFLLVGQGG